MLNTHCAILVCSSGSIAVVVSGGRVPNEPDDPAGVIRIKTPRIVIAADPDPGDCKARSYPITEPFVTEGMSEAEIKQLKLKYEKKQAAKVEYEAEKVEYEHKVTLTKVDATRNEEPPQDVLASILDDMRSSAKDKTSAQEFNEHVRTYFRYLRAVHAAHTSDEHRAAVARFHDYVYAKSCHELSAALLCIDRLQK